MALCGGVLVGAAVVVWALLALTAPDSADPDAIAEAQAAGQEDPSTGDPPGGDVGGEVGPTLCWTAEVLDVLASSSAFGTDFRQQMSDQVAEELHAASEVAEDANERAALEVLAEHYAGQQVDPATATTAAGSPDLPLLDVRPSDAVLDAAEVLDERLDEC